MSKFYFIDFVPFFIMKKVVDLELCFKQKILLRIKILIIYLVKLFIIN